MAPRKTPARADSPELDALCRDLKAALDRRDECKWRLKEAEEEFERIELALATRLYDAGTESISYEALVLTPKASVNWKIAESRKDQVVRLLKVHVPDLVKETVNAASLSAYLRKEEPQLETQASTWWGELRGMLERSEAIALSIRKR